jgi:predicted nucleic acid-binding protein
MYWDFGFSMELNKCREIIEFRDAFIASIAITHNTTLFTRNINHFVRIESTILLHFLY